MQNIILSPICVDELIDKIASEVEGRILAHQDVKKPMIKQCHCIKKSEKRKVNN